MFNILITGYLLLFSHQLLANGIAPELLLYWGALYSIIVFTFGFALEYWCMYKLAVQSSKHPQADAFKCTLIMNLISTIAGVVVRAPAAYIFVNFLYAIKHSSSILALPAIFLIYVITNTVIEVWVAISYFHSKNTLSRIWKWTFIANFLSMGLIAGILMAKSLWYR